MRGLRRLSLPETGTVERSFDYTGMEYVFQGILDRHGRDHRPKLRGPVQAAQDGRPLDQRSGGIMDQDQTDLGGQLFRPARTES